MNSRDNKIATEPIANTPRKAFLSHKRADRRAANPNAAEKKKNVRLSIKHRTSRAPHKIPRAQLSSSRSIQISTAKRPTDIGAMSTNPVNTINGTIGVIKRNNTPTIRLCFTYFCVAENSKNTAGSQYKLTIENTNT